MDYLKGLTEDYILKAEFQFVATVLVSRNILDDGRTPDVIHTKFNNTFRLCCSKTITLFTHC